MTQNLLLPDLFAALEMAVFERTGRRTYRMLATAPDWFKPFSTSSKPSAEFDPALNLPFLDNFLLDAEVFWEAPDRDILTSGPWVEVTGSEEVYLEALALLLEEKKILLVRELGQTYLERQELLQKAREKNLTYQHLIREIQKKEILLHCIVHDLAGPLTGVKSLFTLLGRENLSERGQRRLQIGKDATQKLEALIRTTLDVFAAELDSLEAFSVDPETAPNLRECIRSVVDILAPAATLRQIHLRIEIGESKKKGCLVTGESNRLERVLFNLLDNAFRYSPEGGEVTVAIQSVDHQIRVTVADHGPGVPADEVPQLFRRFFQGKGRRGKAGLGLYFCRIVVERWGGRIGYSPREGGGSVFWFELPRV